MNSETHSPEPDPQDPDRELDRGPDAYLDETLPVEPGGTLWIDLDFGSVRVESHDAEQVKIEARAEGWDSGQVWFSVSREGNDVLLDGEVERWLPSLVFGRRISVRVRIPRRYSVDIRTRGGRVRLREIGGRVAAETRGGSIELKEADGPALLRTAGGHIEAEKVRDNLRMRTSGGRIEADDAAGQVEARTSGGRIALRAVAGPVDAHTSGGSISAAFTGSPAGSLATAGGSIDVQFPRDAAASLDARTSGGRVEVEHPVQMSGTASKTHVVGDVRGGGPLLRLRTSGGSIRVHEG
jgi:hypothetical protein